MILTGPEIRRQVELGNIEIDPFVPEHANPASVDLTLGDRYLTFEHEKVPPTLDAKQDNPMETDWIEPIGVILLPNRLYLMHTVESVYTAKFVSCIDGKSSLGRLGVLVHFTAGYVDPGFRGQLTLEVAVVHPVRVYAGMRFAQLRFHHVEGELEQYAGNYVGEASRGPVASRSWRQFK